MSNLKEYMVAKLLKAGIINEQEEILDKKAFLEFIATNIKDVESKMSECEENGSIQSWARNTYNDLNKEWIYLNDMKKYMTVDPELATSEDFEDIVDKKMKKDEEKKQKKFNKSTQKVAKRFNLFGLSRLFSRNK